MADINGATLIPLLVLIGVLIVVCGHEPREEVDQ